ncbi:hypothetical protein HanHA300_Chr16g0605571 [Helianthus annuus]|nr:hypothetical protein HanHA300_Chr16g0605571 [Helianthus annuus]KAJ0460051.1 hypothetical protein HanHA89_Chr16g0656121 [Helianthus annuus]KAJ0640497.1 hypothetical protein HanLR1_Chr16g0616171 [Helianthus annuus]
MYVPTIRMCGIDEKRVKCSRTRNVLFIFVGIIVWFNVLFDIKDISEFNDHVHYLFNYYT